MVDNTNKAKGGGSALNEWGLTDLQELFCRNYVMNGGKGKVSAVDAGYSPKGAHVRASELLRLPQVQARLVKLSRESMQEHAPACIKVLADLAVSASSESVRLQAASSVLDRTGYKAPVIVEVMDNRTQADVDRDLAILLGLDPGDIGTGEGSDKVH